ncbi:MAG: FAD binding domain-containing protein [Acidimicrobiia bacterium]|nr:FAD binding domain-containing protein [Acidimicrobiia bacterium]
MYPPTFDYTRAATVEEAVDLMGKGTGKLLAGGHSLLPVMKMRLADPGTLIDIGRIDGLRGVERNGDVFRIGALTTHAMVAAEADAALPAGLREAAGMIGDPQVRNRGTVGGNVAHADPASDLPIVLAALGATFHATGPGGSRSIAAADFFTGLFETALGDDELLTSVDVPAEAANAGSAYAKMFNPASRYAVVGACANVAVGADGTCTSCTVAVGGLTANAVVVGAVGAAMAGKPMTAENVELAAQAAADDLGQDVMGDMHASAEYRRRMLPVFVGRALSAAASRAG